MPECKPLDLRGNFVGRDAIVLQQLGEIDDKRLGDGRIRGILAGKVGDVGGARDIDLEELLCDRRGAVSKSLAITFIDQELMVIDRNDFALADEF